MSPSGAKPQELTLFLVIVGFCHTGSVYGLSENGPHMLIGNDTVRRVGLVGGSASLRVGFGVSEAQARPSGSVSSCCLWIWM